MRIEIDRSPTFADSFIETPKSEPDGISAVLNIVDYGDLFKKVKTDYDPESLLGGFC